MADLQTQLTDQRRKVDFDSYDITVQQLLAMVEDKSIDIAPVYQRQYRWDPLRQSRFIESIFLGIPVPSIFMAANKDGTWELVDGVQRLSTLVHFAGSEKARQKLGLASSLSLEGLEKLEDFRGPFSRFPKSVQTHFLLRPIKVTTLSDKSDMIVRFDLFERLNTGGIALTDQEIRGCIFRGPFNEFLETMAANNDFSCVVKLPKAKQKDGTKEEYVLRFFAFLHNYKNFEHSVVQFLNDYMRKASIHFDYKSNELIFRETFAALAKALPDGIRRKRDVTPVNLYEAIAVGAGLAFQKKKTIHTKDIRAWMRSERLASFTKEGANDKKKVVGRIESSARQFGW